MRCAMQLAIGWLNPASINPVRRRASGVAQAQRAEAASRAMSVRALRMFVMACI